MEAREKSLLLSELIQPILQLVMSKNIRNLGLILTLFMAAAHSLVVAQDFSNEVEKLPVISGSYIDGVENDWLIQKPTEKAKVFRNEESNELILSNPIA